MASSHGELTEQFETRTLRNSRCQCVAVGIDFEIVDGEVVDAGRQYAEVSTLENGEIAEDHVTAILEADGFVGNSGVFGNRTSPQPRLSRVPR